MVTRFEQSIFVPIVIKPKPLRRLKYCKYWFLYRDLLPVFPVRFSLMLDLAVDLLDAVEIGIGTGTIAPIPVRPLPPLAISKACEPVLKLGLLTVPRRGGVAVADVCRAGYSGFLGSVIFFTFNGLGLSKVCFVGVGRDDSRSLPAPPRALCAI